MISLEAAHPSPADRIFLPPHPRWLEKSPRPCQKLRISTLIHWGECVIQFLHVCCYVCVCSYPACLCECICTTSQRCWKRDFSAKHEVEFPYMPKHCQHSYVWIFLLKWMMCIWCLSSAESRGWCMWQQSVCSWWQYFSMLVTVALVMGTTETVYKGWTCRAWQAEYLSAWCFKTGFFVSQVLQSQIYHVECGRVGRRLGGNTLSLVCYASVKVAQRCCHAHTSHSGTTLGLRTFQFESEQLEEK